MADRTVTTLHGRQDFPTQAALPWLQRDAAGVDLEWPAPADRQANFVATVHHGIPTNLHKPHYNPRGGYVAFLGRISPEKRPDRAIV